MPWSGILKNCMGGLNCLRFFDICKYSLPHICIYNRFQSFIKNNDKVFNLHNAYFAFVGGSPPPDPGVKLLFWCCKSATILFDN